MLNYCWGWGFGVWVLGIGDCAQSPIPNPQSPIPNPQSPIYKFKLSVYKTSFYNLFKI